MTGVLNSMAAHHELDYFVLLGDNFYDKFGSSTTQFFAGLSLEASAKIHAAVMGNHDFWEHGSPPGASDESFGNGHMQWYAQDAVASELDSAKPFDFSINPSSKKIAAVTNFIWYNMIGNVALIGFSGAHSWGESVPHFEKTCQWIASQRLALVLLLGHWNSQDGGCAPGMNTENVYKTIQKVKGCDDLWTRLKFFEGHDHRNRIVEKNVGFCVGDFGFDGVGDLGLPILDTRNGRAKLYYFPLGTKMKRSNDFDEILGCISAKGFSACAQYSQVWLDQPLDDMITNSSIQYL